MRTRYNEADVTRLLSLAWWDWPAEHLTRHVRTAVSGSTDALEAAAPAGPRRAWRESRRRRRSFVTLPPFGGSY